MSIAGKGVKGHQDYDYIDAERIRPRNDNVLIRWANTPETTPSGLVALPANDNSRDIDGRLAVVVAVGEGPSYTTYCNKCCMPRHPHKMQVQVGDKVIADGRKVGELLYVNGLEHRMVRENELLAVVES